MADEAKIVISVDLDTREVDAQFKELESKAGKAGQSTGDAFDGKAKVDGFTSSLNTLNIAFGNLAAIGIANAIGALKDFATGSIDAFRQFETGLIGVAKTTNLSSDEIEKLAQRIQDLAASTPVASDNLLEIAQSAGQLGIRGVDNIVKFTETIAKLGTASNISGEQAATALAQVLNITRESTDSIDVLASTIVALGNSFETNEALIVSSTQEIAKATAQFGVTSGEAAALGTALQSVGVAAESGGTTISKSFLAIQDAVLNGGKSFQVLQKITQLTGAELKKQFETNAIGVFQKFIEGLSRLDSQGQKVATTLDQFGLTGIRINKNIPALVSNLDGLTRALQVQAAEAQNATALETEFEAATKTLDASIQVFRNTLTVLQQQFIAQFAPAIKVAIDSVTEFLGLFTETEAEKISRIGQEIKNIEAQLLSAQERVSTVGGNFFANLFGGTEQTANDLLNLTTRLKELRAEQAALLGSVGDTEALTRSSEGLNENAIQVENLNTKLQEIDKTQLEALKMELDNLGASDLDLLEIQLGERLALIDNAAQQELISVEEASDLRLKALQANQKKASAITEKNLRDSSKRITSILQNGIVNVVQKSFAFIGQKLVEGGFSFKSFVGVVLGIIADLLLQLSGAFIAIGLGIEAIKASVVGLTAGPALAAGLALAILGGALKAFSSSLTSESAPGGGGVVPAGGSIATGGFAGDDGDEDIFTDTPEREEEQPAVTVNIQGDVLDSEETGLRIVELLNSAFDRDGAVVTGGTFV